MEARDRRPDWQGEAFWRWAIEACGASPSILGAWFPYVVGKTWGTRKNSARHQYQGLDWPEITRDPYLFTRGVATDPPDGWPVEQSKERYNPHENAPIILTTEERIERDRLLRKANQELTDIKAKYASAHEDAEIEDRLIRAIDARVSALESVPVPSFSPRNPGRPESVVALMSDYHIGERVDFEETGGINHYDFDTFSRRYQYHVDSVGGICFGKLTGYDFPELVIVGLGDMVSGIIHDELVETSDGTLMDWLIDGSVVLAAGIRQLACEFPALRVEWHFGNHGRVTQKPRFKRRWVNYDYLLGHMISRELRDQANVTFVNHRSFWSLTEVQGHHLLNLHGDNIRGWGGLPSYGINRAVANLQALLASQRKRFDVVNLGHFHQTGLIERMDVDVVLNGSAIGANEYSVGALFAGARPRQVIYGMHPERGRTWQYAVDLSNGDSHECRFR